MPDVFIHPDRRPAKLRPLTAWRHMQQLIADKEDTRQVFHIIEALNGRAFEKNFRAFAQSEKGSKALARKACLAPVLDDHDWIRALPDATVGRAYVDFMQREGLTAQGLVDESEKFRGAIRDFDDDYHWFGNRLRDTHDLFHVLSGYGRDALGEASLLAFTYSQNPGLGVIFISYMGSRQIKKGVPKAARIMDCFREGKRNGAAASRIVREDIIALLHEPLDAARARLNIARPVAYLHALDVCAKEGLVAGQIGLDSNAVEVAA